LSCALFEDDGRASSAADILAISVCWQHRALRSEIVRSIFRRYADLGSVRLLNDELEARRIDSRSWTSASGRLVSGKPFPRGAFYPGPVGSSCASDGRQA